MMITLLLTTVAAVSRRYVAERAANMTMDEALKAVKPEVSSLYQKHKRGKLFLENMGSGRLTEMLNGMYLEAEEESDSLKQSTDKFLARAESELSFSQADLSQAVTNYGQSVTDLNQALSQEKTSSLSIETYTTQRQEKSESCKEDKMALRDAKGALENDILVAEKIANVSKCEETQPSLMQCIFLKQVDSKGKKRNLGYYVFNHNEATEAMTELKSKRGRQNVQETLESIYEGPGPRLFFQTESREHRQLRQRRRKKRTVMHTKSTEKKSLSSSSTHVAQGEDGDNGNDDSPTPQGADLAAPPATNPLQDSKQEQKCSLSKASNCPKFQENILSMQGAMRDDLENTSTELSEMETTCETELNILAQQLADAEQTLSKAQSQIAESTTKKTMFKQTASFAQTSIADLNKDIANKKAEYAARSSELAETMCGVQKIRGEILKFQKVKELPEDCQVSDWAEGECSATCDGGERINTRSIVSPERHGGAACPPLEEHFSCNVKPCPQDCIVNEWSGFSACSAECDGGVETNTRIVERSAKFGGESCGETQITQVCHTENCNEDCKLAEWTEWSGCSTACDGGYQRRKRETVKPARGTGNCPPDGMQDEDTRPCNTMACADDIECASKVDVMILFDSSGSMGKKGFEKTRKFVADLVKRFQIGEDKAKVGSIMFSGPATYGAWKKCVSPEGGSNEECGLAPFALFSDGLSAGDLAAKVMQQKWIRATTNTADALVMAGQQLKNGGRQDATSIVFVITDGNPNRKNTTGGAARALRDSGARLIFVPIGRYVNIKNLKRWASKPGNQNVIRVNKAKNLEKKIPKFIAEMCPVVYSKKENNPAAAVAAGDPDSTSGTEE